MIFFSTFWKLSIIVFSSSFFISCNYQQKLVLVTRVYDGDTFSSFQRRFRIFAIDAPELNVRDQLGQNYAQKARHFLKTKIENAKVSLEVLKKDVYQRQIVKVNYQNQDLGALLVAKGYALFTYFSLDPQNHYYYPDNKYFFHLQKLQSRARAQGLGFWKLKKEELYKVFPKHFKKLS